MIFLLKYILFNSESNADKRFSVRIGSSIHESGGRIYNITKAIIHPKYDTFAIDFDIALLNMAKPISFTACTVRPAQLIEEGVLTLPGTMATVTGWGSRVVKELI